MRYLEPKWQLEPVLKLLGTRAFMALHISSVDEMLVIVRSGNGT